MKNSSLEINDREYLIKLPKEDFDLSFIHQLLKRIQEQQFFFSNKYVQEQEDIKSRYWGTDKDHRFDDLGDK